MRQPPPRSVRTVAVRLAAAVLVVGAVMGVETAAAQAPSAPTPAGAASLPARTGDGFDYVFRVAQETVDERGRARAEPAFIARARTRDGAIRVDFLPGTQGNTPGDWYVTRDGGQTLTIVSVADRTLQDVNVAAVRQRLTEEKGLTVSVADLATTVRPEGACGTVAGWPTTCAVVERRYTVRTRYWVMRTESRVTERVRLWIAPALPDFVHPFDGFFGSRTELLVRRDSSFAAGEREALRALPAGGVLRTESVLTESNGPTRSTITRTIESYRVRRAEHDPRLFAVPSDYRLVRR